MTDGEILRFRACNLYLTQTCPDLEELSRELLGMHAWFFRNVRYSALIRGADTYNWKNRLIKTWIHRGTLHAVAPDDLSLFLAMRPREEYLNRFYDKSFIAEMSEEVLRQMEDGVCSRRELREIFADKCDYNTIENLFSPWGGIMVNLAAKGKIAFKDVTSRDFEMVDAGIIPSREDAFREVTRRYFTSYAPAAAADAAGFLGVSLKEFTPEVLSEFESFESGGRTYYYAGLPEKVPETPEVMLLSGFDPYLTGYGASRDLVLPAEYKRAVVALSGICNPTIAVNGRVAGLWNVKNGRVSLSFFKEQPKRVEDAAREMLSRLAAG